MGCLFGGEARLKCLQSLKMETFVRLTQVIGINLKPNEDVDYAKEPFLPMSPMEALRSGMFFLSTLRAESYWVSSSTPPSLAKSESFQLQWSI